MNNKLPSLLFCLFLVGTALGANVVWNAFELGDVSSSFEGGRHFNLGYDGYSHVFGLAPSVGFSVGYSGTRATLSAEADTVMLAFYGTWCLADYGSLVSGETTFGSGTTFFDARIHQQGTSSDYNVIINSGESIYLIFGTRVGGQEALSYYGWVQLANVGGDIQLWASAIDLDGGPMIVGGGSAIPEPSGVVLLLVGAGLLGLRRLRRSL